MGGDQRLEALVGDELEVGRPAPAQGRHEHREPVGPAPHHRPVDLHLLARRRLEAHHRLRGGRRRQAGDELLQHRVAARIALLAQLDEQHAGRDPLRRRSREALHHVVLERVELARSGWPLLVARRRLVAQVAPHRVARQTRRAGNLADALPCRCNTRISNAAPHPPSGLLPQKETSLRPGSGFSRRLGQFHIGGYTSPASSRRSLGYNRPASAAAPASPQGWTSSGGRPRCPDGHPVRAALRHPLGDAAG